ncbi:MFS transporter [Streptomycetaceae bacterium NBC_01309]
MAELRTFHLPESVGGDPSDRRLGADMIDAWRTDGIFQVALDPRQNETATAALAVSRNFFRNSAAFKASHVSDLTYSGYVASGEEITAGEVDASEIFTVCPDLREEDSRVVSRWPCHGPVPWPDQAYARRMRAFMTTAGALGEKLLRLTALGLGLADIDALTKLTADGWHHMRVLRFPVAGREARGIGAHTDYGLLVIAAQDEVGGLYVRPPVEGEQRLRNWLPAESTAGMYEDDEPWTYVRPTPSVVTVFPGDILQFMTDGLLLSTPHKVRLDTRERFALAYFHEPNFAAVARPLLRPGHEDEFIHYGTHFTSMFMRCYPDRITTKRIAAEGRLSVLEELRREAVTAR